MPKVKDAILNANKCNKEYVVLICISFFCFFLTSFISETWAEEKRQDYKIASVNLLKIGEEYTKSTQEGTHHERAVSLRIVYTCNMNPGKSFSYDSETKQLNNKLSEWVFYSEDKAKWNSDLNQQCCKNFGNKRFIAYANGTVLDKNSGLMWASEDNGSALHWEDTKSYCDNYRGGGYTDWRVPTQDELHSLWDESFGKGIPCQITLTDSVVWASETSGYDKAYFHFHLGKRFWLHQLLHYKGRALPVRNAK